MLPGAREDLPWRIGRDGRVVAETVGGSPAEIVNQLVWRARAPWLLVVDQDALLDPDGLLCAYEALDNEAFDEDEPVPDPSAMAYRGATLDRHRPWAGTDLSLWLRQTSGHWGPGQVLWRRAWIVDAGGFPAMPNAHWLLAALAAASAPTTTVPGTLADHPPPDSLHLGWIGSRCRSWRSQHLLPGRGTIHP